MRTILTAAVLLTALPACRASVDVNAKAAVNENNDDDFMGSESDQPPPQVVRTEYFGVARRLTLQPKEYPPTCNCVAAVVGETTNPSFDWHGKAPDVGHDALVVAIQGTKCEYEGNGPSISAIDQRGNDVIVVLEEWKHVRPFAAGAIIPNPGPGGAVYLRPRNKGVPYGRPTAQGYGPSHGWCLIGKGTQFQP